MILQQWKFLVSPWNTAVLISLTLCSDISYLRIKLERCKNILKKRFMMGDSFKPITDSFRIDDISSDKEV